MKHTSEKSQKMLFRKHKRIIAEFDDERRSFPAIKIAILSGITVHPLKDILELLLLELKIDPVFFEGDYNSYKFEARFSEGLVVFQPDIIYVHTNIDNILNFPDISMELGSISSVFDLFWGDHQQTIEALLLRTNAHLILNNFEYPNYRINGNFEGLANGGRVRYVSSINMHLADFIRTNNRISLNDINYLAAKVGLETWRDDKNYCAFKQPFSSRAVVEISRSIASLINVILGRVNKCIVLDLDNTMWGGVIGDDGVENIEIGMETPTGEAYLSFQKAIRPLLKRGIGFAVCSKNECEAGKAGLNKEAMHIKESDFHILRINWQKKSSNILDVHKTLNIGLDSMVFIDDSEFEREEVGYSLPDLHILDVEEDPFTFIQAISNEYAFETIAISEEDLDRDSSFKGLVEFVEQKPDDIDDFLQSLEMKLTISELSEHNEARIHQLINKTNQFNLTTKRMSVGDLDAYKVEKTMIAVSLEDKNFNYGLISVLWGNVEDDIFVLENWVMSCRVFNRKLEYFFFYVLYIRLKQNNIMKIKASFIPSQKNAPVANLLSDLGLNCVLESSSSIEYETIIPNNDIEKLETLERLFRWK